MLSILLFTINAVLPVILLMCLGYGLKRIGFFTPDFLKAANRMVFYVCLPVLLFKNIADVDSITEINGTVVIYALAVIAVLMFCGFLLTFLIPDARQKGVIMQCIFRSNFALLGVSLAELMAGEAGVLSAAVLSAFTVPVFNILAVITLSVFRQDGKKLGKKDVMAMLKKIAKNPLIIGVMSGIAVLLLKPYVLGWANVNAPVLRDITFVNTVISYLARSASPLALLVLGGQFDFSRIRGYKKQLIIGVAGRNVLAPLIGIGTAVVLQYAGLVTFNAGVYASLIALFGTPVAVASAVMAEEMGSDGQLAGQLVAWTTFLSIISITVVVFAVRALGLI